MKRKALSLILAFAMAVSLFTVGASAAEPTYGDTAGHWAEASIERWSGYGIIQGSNGKFDPDGQLTCAQLATILARLLKLPAAKDAGFIDNPADAWYYDAINRCAAAGILKGNGDGTVKSVASDTDVTVETKNTEVKNTGRSEITVTDAKDKETTVKPGTSTTVNKESASSGGSSGGSYTPPAQHTHTWDAGVVTKEPTCTEAGVKTYTCTTCSVTKTEGIPALGHDWSAYTVTKHAVNGNNGEKTRTCSRCGTPESAPLLYKFYLGIESGSTVDMTVGEDYTTVFTMPAAGGTVNTGSIDLTAKMQDVASLGVEGVKSHTTTISTGLGGTEVALNTWLPKCYSFSGADITANVNGTSCIYNIGAINKDGELYTVEAAPANIDAARAAWQELTKHVTTSTQGSDDSKIVIKNGAYLMIGTEKLEFTSSEVGDLMLDNFNNMNALNETIRNHVKLSTCTDQGGTITMYLPAGTQLAVGGSVATLKDNCTITITLDPDEMGDLSHALSSLKNETDATMMVKELVQQFDNLIGAIDATGNVTVNVSFT